MSFTLIAFRFRCSYFKFGRENLYEYGSNLLFITFYLLFFSYLFLYEMYGSCVDGHSASSFSSIAFSFYYFASLFVYIWSTYSWLGIGINCGFSIFLLMIVGLNMHKKHIIAATFLLFVCFIFF